MCCFSLRSKESSLWWRCDSHHPCLTRATNVSFGQSIALSHTVGAVNPTVRGKVQTQTYWDARPPSGANSTMTEPLFDVFELKCHFKLRKKVTTIYGKTDWFEVCNHFVVLKMKCISWRFTESLMIISSFKHTAGCERRTSNSWKIKPVFKVLQSIKHFVEEHAGLRYEKMFFWRIRYWWWNAFDVSLSYGSSLPVSST